MKQVQLETQFHIIKFNRRKAATISLEPTTVSVFSRANDTEGFKSMYSLGKHIAGVHESPFLALQHSNNIKVEGVRKHRGVMSNVQRPTGTIKREHIAIQR
eukprot:TRINITY_DN12005_c0_g5_i6.p1 TRINITY_DN12005_c0_g5~~TRINITY_DN12005_c0_g5_i6.p1  ORF type:complete len:101 (-),score=4.15 TRINITY_DN12005_c0_g5_i6:15-317(-)